MSTPTNIDSHRSRMLSALLPKSCSALRVLGLPIGNPVAYHLCRLRRGAEVSLIFDSSLVVNISLHLKKWPEDFEAARTWMRELEVRFGLSLPERRRTRRRLQLVAERKTP